MENNSIKGTVQADFTIEHIDGTMALGYDFNWFTSPSDVYSHALCRFACSMVTLGYDKITSCPEAEAETGFPYTQTGLKTALDAMGFTHQEIQPKAERDEVSYFLACRNITLDGKEYCLALAAFIGSYKKTWYSNFDPYGVDRVANGGKGYAGDAEKGKIHLGFADARDYMHEKTAAFLRKYAGGKEIKILVTGHSRGAAAANLLGAKLLQNGGFGEDLPVDKANLYTYCFATPNFANTKMVDVTHARYRQIFSIVNPEDFVTEVLPKTCGFGKFGKVYALMGSDNQSFHDYRNVKSAMQHKYRDYKSSKVYLPYPGGNKTVQNIAKIMAESMPDFDTFYNKKMKECYQSVTAFEYYKYTLCGYVAGTDTPEDQANRDRAMKLMIGSAFDLIGTSPAFRNVSRFFVFKEGIGGATGNKIGGTYFSDSHRCETYLAFLMAMREEQLIEQQ